MFFKLVITLINASLLLSFTSCGKSSENTTKKSDDIRFNLNIRESSFRFEVNQNHSFPDYRSEPFPAHAKIAIPDSVRINSGAFHNLKVRLFFNVNENGHDFFCDYEANLVMSDFAYSFIGCYAEFNSSTNQYENLEYTPGQWEYQDKDNYLTYQIIEPEEIGLFNFYTNIEVDWH